MATSASTSDMTRPRPGDRRRSHRQRLGRTVQSDQALRGLPVEAITYCLEAGKLLSRISTRSRSTAARSQPDKLMQIMNLKLEPTRRRPANSAATASCDRVINLAREAYRAGGPIIPRRKCRRSIFTPNGSRAAPCPRAAWSTISRTLPPRSTARDCRSRRWCSRRTALATPFHLRLAREVASGF